jgi:hypothetical protein
VCGRGMDAVDTNIPARLLTADDAGQSAAQAFRKVLSLSKADPVCGGPGGGIFSLDRKVIQWERRAGQ